MDLRTDTAINSTGEPQRVILLIIKTALAFCQCII